MALLTPPWYGTGLTRHPARTSVAVDASNDDVSDQTRSEMIKVAIILGSTRPGRRGEPVAQWVYDRAVKRGDAEYELIDLADYPLPHLDEAMPPSMGRYANQHTLDWSATIASFD